MSSKIDIPLSLLSEVEYLFLDSFSLSDNTFIELTKMKNLKVLEFLNLDQALTDSAVLALAKATQIKSVIIRFVV